MPFWKAVLSLITVCVCVFFFFSFLFRKSQNRLRPSTDHCFISTCNTSWLAHRKRQPTGLRSSVPQDGVAGAGREREGEEPMAEDATDHLLGSQAHQVRTYGAFGILSKMLFAVAKRCCSDMFRWSTRTSAQTRSTRVFAPSSGLAPSCHTDLGLQTSPGTFIPRRPQPGVGYRHQKKCSNYVAVYLLFRVPGVDHGSFEYFFAWRFEIYRLRNRRDNRLQFAYIYIIYNIYM